MDAPSVYFWAVEAGDSGHSRSDPTTVPRTTDTENHIMPATQALPPPRAIFAVDTEKFTRNPSARQPQLRAAITELLASAFARCGLAEVWEARKLPQGTGDGFVFAIPQERTPFLLDPLLDRFQEVLEERDRLLRSEDRSLRLRVRVAIHMGSVSDSDGQCEGVGTPMNDTFRLLDSEPVRQELSQSNPDITLLAAIVSQRVFEDVVRAGYTPGLPPERFQPVIAEVAGKEFVQPAWVYVPKPSRASDRTMQSGAAQDSGDAGSKRTAPVGRAPGGTTIHGSVGNSITGGSFSAEVRQQMGGSGS